MKEPFLNSLSGIGPMTLDEKMPCADTHAGFCGGWGKNFRLPDYALLI